MKEKKVPASVPYDIGLMEDLKDPEFIGPYLSACIDGRTDEDFEVFWSALQSVAKAHGISQIAEKSGMSRDAFYKTFKAHRNPTIKSLRKILNALNLEIAVVPKRSMA